MSQFCWNTVSEKDGMLGQVVWNQQLTIKLYRNMHREIPNVAELKNITVVAPGRLLISEAIKERATFMYKLFDPTSKFYHIVA